MSIAARNRIDQGFQVAWLAALVGFALYLSGCSHAARHFEAPNSTALVASSRKLSAAVDASKSAVGQASAAVKTAKANHDTETKRIAAIEPKVTDLLRVAPLELRPAVEALENDVTALHGEHELTGHSIDSALAAQGIATGELEKATAAEHEVDQFRAEYITETEKMAARLNDTEIKWAKDSKALAWYRLHWFIGILVMIGGIALCIIWGLVKFTARGAATAAKFGL